MTLPHVLIVTGPTASGKSALVLTGQVFLGAVLGIVAQAFFFYIVIVLLLPVFGLDLLSLARAVAAPDLRGTLIHWVLGPPAH